MAWVSFVLREGGEVYIQLSHIRYFFARGDGGTVITMGDDDYIVVKESLDTVCARIVAAERDE